MNNSRLSHTQTQLVSFLLKAWGGRHRIPQHVAFIMDGNRRFASAQQLGKLDGHTQGSSKMVEVIRWCLELGVRYISVYAFSIDNFQRSPDEVGGLMKLAEDKYKELAQEEGLPEQEGVEVRILGELDLAPPSVKGAAARLMQATGSLRNKRAVLNICFAYTSSEETVHAIDTLQHAQQDSYISHEDLTPEVFRGCLRTQDSPPVDLLIRTSGETRLSDFLVWQTSHAHLAFVDRLWPDFLFSDFVRCILDYQRHAPFLQSLKRCCQHHEPEQMPGSSKSDKPLTFQPCPFSSAHALLQHLPLPAVWKAALSLLLRLACSALILLLAAAAAMSNWVLSRIGAQPHNCSGTWVLSHNVGERALSFLPSSLRSLAGRLVPAAPQSSGSNTAAGAHSSSDGWVSWPCGLKDALQLMASNSLLAPSPPTPIQMHELGSAKSSTEAASFICGVRCVGCANSGVGVCGCDGSWEGEGPGAQSAGQNVKGRNFAQQQQQQQEQQQEQQQGLDEHQPVLCGKGMQGSSCSRPRHALDDVGTPVALSRLISLQRQWQQDWLRANTGST